MGQCRACTNIQNFLAETAKTGEYHIYEIDGTPVNSEALHPVAIPATVAQASLATDTETARDWVLRFWDLPMRTGKWRYYDNCLYVFAFLALSGNYRIWA